MARRLSAFSQSNRCSTKRSGGGFAGSMKRLTNAIRGGEVGAVIGAFHRANGVELLPESRITAFEGTERLEAAVTANGDRVPCDFAVVGIGIEPDVPTFASAVAQENGVLVDELCRASAADVYAAGDVANHLRPVFGRVRVEHFNNGE